MALPGTLRARGLEVTINHDHNATVVELRGSSRHELAVLEHNRPVRWRSLAPHPPDVLRLLLGAAGLVDGDTDLRHGQLQRPGAIDQPSMLLEHEELPELRWAIRSLDKTVLRGSPSPPEPAGEDPERSRLADTVQAAGFTEVPIPRAHGDGIDPTSPSNDRPASSTIEIDPRVRTRELWLAPDGLHRRVFDGRHATEKTAKWRTEPVGDWAAEGWNPAPKIIASTRLEAVEAVVARVGRHVMLGVNYHGQIRWSTLQDEPLDPARALLGRILLEDQQALLQPVAVTAPGAAVGPELEGGELRARAVRPMVTPSTDGSEAPQAIQAALQWIDGAAPATPPAARLTGDLTERLLQLADRRSGPLTLRFDIGAEVRERWLIAGREVTIISTTHPGEPQAFATSEATGEALRRCRIDRSGHIVGTTKRCRYCATSTCPRCQAAASECAICGIVVCGRCSAQHPLCPACGQLRRASGLTAWRLRKERRRGGVVLAGHDPIHDVVCFPTPTGWTVHLQPVSDTSSSVAHAAMSPPALLLDQQGRLVAAVRGSRRER